MIKSRVYQSQTMLRAYQDKMDEYFLRNSNPLDMACHPYFFTQLLHLSAREFTCPANLLISLLGMLLQA